MLQKYITLKEHNFWKLTSVRTVPALDLSFLCLIIWTTCGGMADIFSQQTIIWLFSTVYENRELNCCPCFSRRSLSALTWDREILGHVITVELQVPEKWDYLLAIKSQAGPNNRSRNKRHNLETWMENKSQATSPASPYDRIDTGEVWDFKVFSPPTFVQNKTSVNRYFWIEMHFSKIYLQNKATIFKARHSFLSEQHPKHPGHFLFQ